MKRLIPFLAVLLCIVAVPVFALDETPVDSRDRAAAADRDRDRTSIIDDVIRMSQAGVSDDSIIKFIRQSRERYVMNADVIIQLTDAKVSKAVIDELLDGADTRRDDRNYRDSRGRSTTVYVNPYPYYGFYASPFWYDPWFYGPRVSFSVGFGRYWGGGFYRGWHGGHRGHR